jgi:hypothetical protein
MSHLRVYRAEVTLSGAAGSKLRIYRAEVTTTAAISHLRIYRAEVQAAVQISHLRIYRAEVKTALPVSAGNDQLGLEPGDIVTVTGTGGDAGGASSWTQVSGPTVQLTVAGAVATFRAPPNIDPGAIVVLRYTVNGAYDDISITVLRALRATWNGSKFIGVMTLRKENLG